MMNNKLKLPCGTKVEHTRFVSASHEGHQLAVTHAYPSGTVLDMTDPGNPVNVDSSIIRIDHDALPMIIKFLQDILEEPS